MNARAGQLTDGKRPLRWRVSRAFTLIEVLLAVAIFSLVLLAVHYIFHGALRLRNRTTESIEAALPLEQALAIIRRDIANVVPPGGTLAGAFQTTPSVDGMNTQPSLQFTTAVGILSDQSPWGEFQRVAYTLTAPTNNSKGRELHRAVTRNLLPVSQAIIDDQPLLGGVETLTFSFHDGSSWRTTWDSSNDVTILPRAIKVDLLMVATNAAQASARQPVELIVGLLVEPSTNSPTQAQSTGGGS